MRLAVIIKAERREELPTAAELRYAGFAVSTALEPGRDVDAPGTTPCAEDERKPDGPGPVCRLPERQRP